MSYKTNKIYLKNQAGFAALLATLAVLAAMLLTIGGAGLLTISEQKTATNSLKSAQAYFAADSGAQDSLYRIIKGKNYQASNSLGVAGASAAINITDDGGQKIISVNGERDNRFRNLQIKLNVNTDAISFHYGVQVGAGGLIMSNNSRVTGSIYSNGSVSGSNGAAITGDAFVGSAAGDINQQSEIVDADFIFGRTSPAIDAAQSFIPSVGNPLNKVSLYLKKTGSPASITVRILTDNGDKPSKTLAAPGAYGTLNAGLVSQNNYGWVDVVLNTPPNLTAGTKYWIAADASANSNNYFYWGKDSTNAYGGGSGKYSANWNASSPVWNDAAGDLAFRVYLGGDINFLSNAIIGGNAHANTISGCSIAGDAYYQTISGSTVGGVSYPGSQDPAMESMPISESNINDWKAEAEAGGSQGDYTLTNGAIGSLGPRKIIGNLNLFNNADLTITGTVYVTGNINISNGGKLRLGSNYGNLSGVIIADGSITVSNNSIFYSNGAGTYLMLLSTKSGSAINVSNNANAVIFYAANGAITISNNAVLKEATGYQISLANGAQIVYESGLANIQFSSGPGASWSVENWAEVP